MNGILANVPSLVWVVLLVIIAITVLVKWSYVKAPPNKVAVISGLGKNPRTLKGTAGFKIPVLERVDWLDIGQITIDIDTNGFIPTKDFINVKVDAVVQATINADDPELLQTAMRNFLNKNLTEIKEMTVQSLLGNLREIIGTMDLKTICQDKATFSQRVKDSAQDDMNSIGIKILSFNVQQVVDKENLIQNLGIENTSKIKKDALIAQSEADKEVEMARSKNADLADEARVTAEQKIAERNNALEIKKANLKVTEDTEKAKADAAYKIQQENSRKEIEIASQDAEIANRAKEVELQEREVEVQQKRLEVEIEKQADADKYAEQAKAEAELYRRQKEAEAELYEEQKKAEAIKVMGQNEADVITAKGKAEAEAIKAKGLAEAEAMDKKAEAYQKYTGAAVVEMLVNVLPEIAKNVAEPISAIDKVSIIGGNADGVSGVSGNVPAVMAQVFQTVQEATGVDMTEIVKANTYDAKVTRNLNVTGVSEKKESKKDEDVSLAEDIVDAEVASSFSDYDLD